MKLIYEGYDKAGKAVRGVVDAKDTNDAKDSLRKQSIFAVKLRAAEAGGLAMMEDHDQRRIRGNTARLERVSFMMRQLSLLVATGTTVVEALASLHSQAGEGEWKKVVGAIRVKVEEGKTLAEAMGQHPQYFDAVAISLIAAGEAGGQLSVMSDRLSKLIRQQVRIRKTVSQAMIYPAVLMCVAAVVIVTMVTFVLPRFEGLFASLGTDLPAMTKVLMTINHFLRAQWYFVVGGLVATIGGGYAYFRSLKGQQTLDAAAAVGERGHAGVGGDCAGARLRGRRCGRSAGNGADWPLFRRGALAANGQCVTPSDINPDQCAVITHTDGVPYTRVLDGLTPGIPLLLIGVGLAAGGIALIAVPPRKAAASAGSRR